MKKTHTVQCGICGNKMLANFDRNLIARKKLIAKKTGGLFLQSFSCEKCRALPPFQIVKTKR